MKQRGDRLVVYFDGVCTLCNAFVDFLLRVDRAGVLRFASLQGEAARSAGLELPEGAAASIVVDEGGRHYRQSDAVLRLMAALGGRWRLLSHLGALVPRLARDGIYRLVARHRYRLFGKRETCRLPTAAEKARFLP